MQLYLVRMRRPGGGEDFFKIGVSENALNRFKYGTVRVLESDLSLRDKIARLAKSETYIPDHPYDIDYLKIVDFAYEGEARLAEKEILETVGKIQYWPKEHFSGRSECFAIDDELEKSFIEEMLKYMDHLAHRAELRKPDELKYKLAHSRVKKEKLSPLADAIELHLATLQMIESVWPSK